LKYGFARSNQGGGIHLHARKISFTHPVTKEEVVIVANPPVEDQLWQEFMMQAGD
jgi:23S rRNA pseudouridine1911/1915/1917 synthase